MAKKMRAVFSKALRNKNLVLLVLIVLLGGCFRFYNLNWDAKHSFHPDERNILGQTTGIQPANGYKVSFFAYGQLPVFLYRATGELVSTPRVFFGFFRGNQQLAQWAYWLTLLVFLGAILWFFPREKWKIWSFGISAFLFATVLFFQFAGEKPNDIFNTWFTALENQRVTLTLLSFLKIQPLDLFILPIVNLVIVGVVSLLVSVLAARILEMDWVGLPSNIAGGVIAIFGIVPAFLPESFGPLHLPVIFATLAFTLLVAVMAGWLAWVSRAGRLLLALLAVWAFFASLPHAGFTYTGYGELMIIGRWWAAVFSSLTIVAVYLFATRVYRNTTLALIAAASMAFAVVSIEQAHYCITESLITLMVVVIAVLSYEIAKKGDWRSYLLTGGAFGLAMAAKTSSLYYLFIIMAAHLVSLASKTSDQWKREDRKITGNLEVFTTLTFAFPMAILFGFYFIGEKLKTIIHDLFPLNGAPAYSMFAGLIFLLAVITFLAVCSWALWKVFNSGLNIWLKTTAFIFTTLYSWLIFIGNFFQKEKFEHFRAIKNLFSSNQPFHENLWLIFAVFLASLGVLFAGWLLVENKIVRGQMPQWIKLGAAGGLAFLIFCLLSPWSLLDQRGFQNSMQYEWRVVSIADACYVIQFKDTARYLYHLLNLMHVELWWPLGVTVVLGMFWVLGRFIIQLFRPVKSGYLLPLPFARNLGWRFSLPDFLLLAWFIPYFGFIGAWNTKFIRYMVPLIPIFCLFGAKFLTDVFQWVKSKWPLLRAFRPVVLTVVLGCSLFYSMAYMNVYRNPHPWIEASVWIFKHIPAGSMILTEAWDDGLPTGVDSKTDPRVDRLMGPQNYRGESMTVYEKHGYPTDDSPIKRNYYANILQKGEYISIASKKLWYSLVDSTPEFRPKGYKDYPITSRYYRLLWSGLLGYKMVAEIHNFPKFLGWEHPDDMAEESFSVYDHPRVYLFEKFETVPPERILKLLDKDDYVKGINRAIMRTITPKNVDVFITERRKYLEDKGLLQQLDASVPISKLEEKKSTEKEELVEKGKTLKPVSTPTAAEEAVTSVIKAEAPRTVPGLPGPETLKALDSFVKNPVTETDMAKKKPPKENSALYQMWAWFSWLVLLMVLGWMALPLTLRVMSPIPSGAYSLSKILGFFVFAWVVWFFANIKLDWCKFTTASCLAWLFILAALSAYFYRRDWNKLKALYSRWDKSWLIQEGAFILAFFAFAVVKIHCSHIHDPVGEGYNGGGEAGMDFGFLTSVVRGEKFPPENMWMAGLPIGYTFYYGHLMIGILTKTLGLVPAVTYNLGLITLFALIFSGAFGLAFALSGRLSSGWFAGFLCAAAGNPVGAKQYLNSIQQCFSSLSIRPLWDRLYNYDYWAPTRVIPFGHNEGSTINEFPYFSVLYGDMHAHTLAMPFAMLLIGIIASIYLSHVSKPFRWGKDWPGFVMAGFLLGGIAFLNTWEVPTWLVLLGIALLVRGLSGLNGKVLYRGISITFALAVFAMTLLGWWSTYAPRWLKFLKIDTAMHALGGATPYLIFFLGLGLAVAVFWLILGKTTNVFSKQIVTIFISVAGALIVAGLLWLPFFLGFYPQQNKIMWVLPDIRTSLKNYFAIYGLFLAVMLLSFVVAYSRELCLGIVKNIKVKLGWQDLPDKLLDFIEKMISPGNAVQGMLSLGLGSLGVIWAASWVHWTEPQDKMLLSLIIATLAAVLFIAAVYFKNRWELWAAEIAVLMLWAAVVMTRVMGIQLVRDMPFTLGLGLFSILWLLAFFHLGLAVKVFRDGKLSFSYLLVSFFFFVTAALEVFAMSEYFGFGNGMRNNSMFKYGINAWILASVATGVFLPKVFDFFAQTYKAVKKESVLARKVMMLVSGAVIFVLLRALLDNVLNALNSPFVFIFNIFAVAGFVAWGFMEGWFKNQMLKSAVVSLASLVVLISLFSWWAPSTSGSTLGLFHRWGEDFSVGVILPLMLAFIVLCLGLWGRQMLGKRERNPGLQAAFFSWKALVTVLLISVSIYPIFATNRKCHGFLPSVRQRLLGYKESPTLNGMEYIARENSQDGAAIRFLNENIPGQPCLVEFVGEGYNSWASRFSIFSGVPALMGWDGHVGEWVGNRLGSDIRKRFNATENIFKTSDVGTAKEYLDAYGVRLVMVGTVERNGVPNRKRGYPPEGLAKFMDFLPLIYKNPGVEIYYNAPATKAQH